MLLSQPPHAHQSDSVKQSSCYALSNGRCVLVRFDVSNYSREQVRHWIHQAASVTSVFMITVIRLSVGCVERTIISIHHFTTCNAGAPLHHVRAHGYMSVHTVYRRLYFFKSESLRGKLRVRLSQTPVCA